MQNVTSVILNSLMLSILMPIRVTVTRVTKIMLTNNEHSLKQAQKTVLALQIIDAQITLSCKSNVIFPSVYQQNNHTCDVIYQRTLPVEPSRLYLALTAHMNALLYPQSCEKRFKVTLDNVSTLQKLVSQLVL